MDIIIAIVMLVVTLGILVTFHEYGHFWAARRCGVYVERFSVGFGKPLPWRWQDRQGCEFVLGPIPLGGYVRLLGQAEGIIIGPDVIPEKLRHVSFPHKPLWQRAFIVAAGPLANLLLAFLVFWALNFTYGVGGIAPVVQGVMADSPAARAGLAVGDEIVAVDQEATGTWQQVGMALLKRLGETGDIALRVQPADGFAQRELRVPVSAWMAGGELADPVEELGMLRLELPARVGDIVPGSPAEGAGMLPGDRVLAVDGRPVQGWFQWAAIVRANPDSPLVVRVARDGYGLSEVELYMRPARVEDADGNWVGQVGASLAPATVDEAAPRERRVVRYHPLSAIGPAAVQLWDNTVFLFDAVGKMVTGDISVRNVNGPITIARVAGDTAQSGLEIYLRFLALISISLAVVNLLPIPMLDGGHLVFILYEAVFRRPMPPRAQQWAMQAGILVVAGIMVLAFYNDIALLL